MATDTTTNPLPSNTQPIDIGALTTAPTFNLPTYTPPQQPTVTPPPPIDFGIDAKKSAVDTTTSELKSALDQQASAPVVRTQLETTAGIPDINKQLSELYAKDAGYAADLSAIDAKSLQATNTSEDRFAPTFAIGGEQAQIARQAQNARLGINIQRATNAAVISAAQGRLSLAQDYVQKALDSEFTPLASKIDYLKTVLTQNESALSNAEKEQLQQQIDANQQAYDEQKQNRTNIYNIMLEAAKNGADNLTLSRIQSATTPDAAIAAAGDALVAQDTQIQNANGRVLLIDKKTGKTIADLGTSDAALTLAQRASTAKAPTATQTTYGNYAPRLQTADQTINALTDSITKTQPVAYALATRLPSWLQSSDIQQYNQAKLNFVNAVLRQESGAAISDSERAAYEKQYFPVPGDSAATIAQKAQNRAQVIQSYVRDAGPAYTGPANDPYADYRSQLQTGEVLVQRGNQIVAVTPDELQANDIQL